jgi:hypothetical protein
VTKYKLPNSNIGLIICIILYFLLSFLLDFQCIIFSIWWKLLFVLVSKFSHCCDWKNSEVYFQLFDVQGGFSKFQNDVFLVQKYIENIITKYQSVTKETIQRLTMEWVSSSCIWTGSKLWKYRLRIRPNSILIQDLEKKAQRPLL